MNSVVRMVQGYFSLLVFRVGLEEKSISGFYL